MKNFETIVNADLIGKIAKRTKGDYVVGRTGYIISIDEEKNRVQVNWTHRGNGTEMKPVKTWVSIKVIEIIS